MNFIKNIFAFIIGLILTYLFYTYISIPIIPVFTLYIFLSLSEKFKIENLKITSFFTILLLLINLYLYGFAIYTSIKYYPNFQNILGIIFEFINEFTFIAWGITFIPHLISKVKIGDK